MNDDHYLDIALAEARAAQDRGEVPIGAVLVAADGAVLAQNGNRTIGDRDPSAHAEMLCIREAARKIGNERLLGTTLYVTLEPCTMCAGAISLARIARLVYATKDPKGGAVEHGAKFFETSTCHHRPQVTTGLRWEEASNLLKTFFKARR